MLAWINWSRTSHLLDLCMGGFPGDTGGKEPACQCRRHQRHSFEPSVGKIPYRRSRQSTPLFLPGESPWTEEPGGQQSIGSQRIGHNWSDLACTYVYVWINFSYPFPPSSICFCLLKRSIVLGWFYWISSTWIAFCCSLRVLTIYIWILKSLCSSWTVSLQLVGSISLTKLDL